MISLQLSNLSKCIYDNIFVCSVIIASLIFLIVLTLEGVLLVLTPVSPFTGEVWVSFPRMQLFVLLEKARDGETLSARVTRPWLLASMSPFMDVQMGCQLVGLPADVAAERALVCV